MKPRIKQKIMRQVIILFLIFSGIYISNGQNTVSPYSIFGPGELQNKGFGRSQAMGGAGIALRSGSSLNNVNPASYTGIDSLRIITEFGVQGKLYNLSTSGKSQTGYTGNFNYLALGFRYNRWLAGSLGVVPFSSVGYSVEKENYIEGLNAKFTSTYVGSGGISQFYFSNAVKLGKHLSLGLTTSYLFGPLVQDENIGATSVNPQLLIVRQDFLRSFYFDYGMQYSFSVKEAEITLGGIFSNRQSLKSKHILNVYNESLSLIQGETYETDYLTVPLTWGVGLGIKNRERYEVLFDYGFQKWSDVSYPNQFDEFKDAHRFSLGGEFRPWDFRVINKSYKNWVYRVGLNYQTSYLSFGNSAVIDKSFSLGAGVPLPGRISNFDWSIRVGENGTTTNRLIREKYVIFQLGFSLNEVAFLKRKFD